MGLEGRRRNRRPSAFPPNESIVSDRFQRYRSYPRLCTIHTMRCVKAGRAAERWLRLTSATIASLIRAMTQLDDYRRLPRSSAAIPPW